MNRAGPNIWNAKCDKNGPARMSIFPDARAKQECRKIDIRAGPFLSHLAFHTNKNAEIQLKTKQQKLRVLRIML